MNAIREVILEIETESKKMGMEGNETKTKYKLRQFKNETDILMQRVNGKGKGIPITGHEGPRGMCMQGSTYSQPRH